MFLTKKITSVCESPPQVANSEIKTTDKKLADGSVTESSVDYTCKEELGYYIEDESNSRLTCALGGVWTPSTVPRCLKGNSVFKFL